jgi:hypothetical protein
MTLVKCSMPGCKRPATVLASYPNDTIWCRCDEHASTAKATVKM